MHDWKYIAHSNGWKIHNTNAFRGNQKSLSYKIHSLANTNTMFKNTLDECSNNQRVNCFQIDTHLTWAKIITISQMNYFQFFVLAFICCNCEVLTASFPFHFRPQGLKPRSILVGETLFNVVGPCRIFSLDVPGCNIR